ncbi:hypothetical protein JVU11DRAFT_10182 [Chiua virens]|nr:hypothetical protein JVU11DRAFT_10182 [Chiua virens]
MQDDACQEKLAHQREALVKEKKRDERIRKREQMSKAAEHDTFKSKPSGIQKETVPIPAVVDKAFESHAVGGLDQTMTRSNLTTPTLVARKGNIPPPPPFPKMSQKGLPVRVCIAEPVQPIKFGRLNLNASDVTATCKRGRAPTPFPGAKIAEFRSTDGHAEHALKDTTDLGLFEDDVGPPFTQRKRSRRTLVSSDEDEPGPLVPGMIEKNRADCSVPAIGDGPQALSSLPVSTLTCKTAGRGRGTFSAKNRPKASDYDPHMQHILKIAIQHYHIKLLKGHSFPEAAVELKWAFAAWQKGCSRYILLSQ